MAPNQSRRIQVSGRTILCDCVGDRRLLTLAKAIIRKREAADRLSVGILNQVLDACRLYALGEAQHVVREVIVERQAQESADDNGDDEE